MKIDRGAGLISSAAELLQGRRGRAKGSTAEIRGALERPRVGAPENMRRTVTITIVERYL